MQAPCAAGRGLSATAAWGRVERRVQSYSGVSGVAGISGGRGASGGRGGEGATPEWVARLTASAEAKKMANARTIAINGRDLEKGEFIPRTNGMNGTAAVDNHLVDWSVSTSTTNDIANGFPAPNPELEIIPPNERAQGLGVWPTPIKKMDKLGSTILISTSPEHHLRHSLAVDDNLRRTAATHLRRARCRAAGTPAGMALGPTAGTATGTVTASDEELETPRRAWRSTSSEEPAEGERRRRGRWRRGRCETRGVSLAPPPPPSPPPSPPARSPSPVRVVRVVDAGVPLVTKDLSFVDNRPVGVDNSLPAFLRRRGAARPPAPAPAPAPAPTDQQPPTDAVATVAGGPPPPQPPSGRAIGSASPPKPHFESSAPDAPPTEEPSAQVEDLAAKPTDTEAPKELQTGERPAPTCKAEKNSSTEFSARAQTHRRGSIRTRPLQMPKPFEGLLNAREVPQRRAQSDGGKGEEKPEAMSAIAETNTVVSSSYSTVDENKDVPQRVTKLCEQKAPEEVLEIICESDRVLVLEKASSSACCG